MKKRILSILLALCMVLGFMPTIAFAEDDHTHCICGGENSVGDHTTHTNIPWTGISALSEITKAGNYYLEDNVELTATWTCNYNVNLCLNGKTIASQVGQNVITVAGGASLTITSCGEYGFINHSGGESGRGIENNGTLTLWNGWISGNIADSDGGGVYNNGTFNMYGGMISGNRAGEDGGGVYNNGTFTMTGGTISGNIADKDGGGVCNYGTLKMSGNVKVTGNESESSYGMDNNVYLPYLPGGKSITVVGSMGASADVGVSGSLNQTVVTGATNTAGFFSDNTDHCLVNNGNGGLKLVEHAHCVCGKKACTDTAHGGDLPWTGISDLSEITAAGNYYLKNDVTLGDIWTCSIEDVNLCLNGKTVSGANDKAVIGVNTGASLVITDCRETAGKIIYVNTGVGNDGTLTLWNGSITSPSDRQSYTDCGVFNNGTFTMNGGSIENNSAGFHDSGVYNTDIFTMNGGRITTKGNHNEIFGVKNEGKFTMNGGSITDCLNKAIYVKGIISCVANGDTFTMTGGSITGNSSGNRCIGVNNGNGKTFTMTGGSITNNSGVLGGYGVYGMGTLIVSGDVNITGNVSGGTLENGVITGGTPSNVYFPFGEPVTVESGKPLAATARIGITAENPASYPTVVTGTTDTAVFFSDNADYMLEDNGSNGLKLTDALVTVSGVKLLNETGGAEMTDGKIYDGKAVAYDDSAVIYTPSVSGVTLNYTWQVKNGGTYGDLTAAPKAKGNYRLLVSAVKNGNTLGTQVFEFTINSYNANGSEYSVNSNDWLNVDFAVTAAEGWQLSYTNTADGNWVSSLTVSEENNNGTLEFYLKNTSTGVISEKVTEHYKIDKTAPSGEVRIDERNAWQTFLNAISFNLFYKDAQTVTVTANDNGSGIARIEYLVTADDLTVEQLADKTFTSYSSTFGIEPDAKLIVYARITDAAGNMTYLRSDGIVLDGTAPVINGADNGKTYCEAVTLTVMDEYLDTVTLNGEPITLTDGKLTVNPAEGRQTVIATDKAGNSTSITVTVNDGHTWGEWVSNGDNTHTRSCKFDAAHTEKADCHGGTATCKDRAVCEICNQEYGSTDPSNHTGALEWVQTANTHKQIYNCCQAVNVAEENHTWENGKCTVCYFVCQHTDTDKNHICDICGKTISDHNGGKATCTKKAVCDYCGKAYGSTDPSDHTGALEWVQTATTHEQKWNCCNAIVVASEPHEWENGECSECGYACLHSGGTAICKDKAICVVCGEEYGDLAPHELTHIDAKEATAAEFGNTEYWYCDVCDEYFSDEDAANEIDSADTVIAKLAPKIINGNGATVTEGEKKALSFTSDAAFEDFIRVEVDGKTVDESSYTVESGSTVVTLNADYVATLAVGEHTLGIVSQSGTAAAKFTVNKKAAETTEKTDKPDTNDKTTSPKTCDSSNLALWFALLFISGGAVIGTTVVSRKKKQERE